MLKLKLDNIKKTYHSGENVVALKGITLGFRKSELVSILGPSGCGKTTLLNIIGGLDQYDSGDLIINGISTKKFKSADWDGYRNKSIGFVFQNYNLISHQSILQNVEIAMTLSGVSADERKKRATKALEEVGLLDKINKKPNQLSGGQMQRVAIARALVNNPDIILADEPTGALDSQTSVQVMNILKDISKTRLVIMVTHNGELADEYSDRIIRLLDGDILSDSNPIKNNGEPEEEVGSTNIKNKFKKTSMSFITALSLSFKNLLTKRGRTIITSFAGSIGIIGVALVLALSSGLSNYMGAMQKDTLSGFPISISTTEQSFDISRRGPFASKNSAVSYTEFPQSNNIYSYNSEENQKKHTNILSDDYLNYIGKLQQELPGAVNTISYQRGVNMNILSKGGDSVVKFDTAISPMRASMGTGNTYWQEMPDNNDFVLSLYDLIGDGSRLPENKNEVAIVVDEYNRLDENFFKKLGITTDNKNYSVNDFLGKDILKIVDNNDFYSKSGNMFTQANPSQYESLYNSSNGVEVKVVGILRIKKDASSSYFSQGFVYSRELTDYILSNANKSEIAIAQKDSNRDLLTGVTFADETTKKARLIALGSDTSPTGISIYPSDFSAKDSIKGYLDNYNNEKSDQEKVVYSDMAETISQMTGTLLNTVSYVLIGFAAISLIVSTIMIGIITYVSVIERTKEIGILRAVGARKKDISRVFNAETAIIGFSAGVLGILISYLLTIPINIIIEKLVGISDIASLKLIHGIILVCGSIILTLIAGILPSRMAAKKDPVEALRTE